MAVTFTQTDTASSNTTSDASCAGAGGVLSPRDASVGAAAGSVAVALDHGNGGSSRGRFSCITTSLTGASGTWTFKLNVTVANMNITLTAVHVCRWDSSGTFQEQLGANTGLSVSLGSTGVKTQSISCSAPSALNSGDIITLDFNTSNSAMSTQSFSFTPNQNIDSPFTEAVLPQIDAQPGSFSNTGVAATLLAGRNINAAPGSYSLTGVDANLVKGFALNAATGSFSLTGVDATFAKNSALPADPGSYALTGVAATLAAGKTFNAEPGAYSLTGVDANLVKGFKLDGGTGTYALTGVDAGTVAARNINAQPGSFAVTGAVANLTAERMLSADTGIYALTGVNATLEYTPATGAYELDAEPGSYGITGFGSELDYAGLESYTETPAGRSRRRKERIIARFKGQEYLFDSPYELQAFVESVKTKKRKPAVKVIVPQVVEEELANFDLPSLQIDLSRLNWKGALKTWEKYESLRKSQPVDFGQVRQHEAYLFRKLLEMEDEELLLL